MNKKTEISLFNMAFEISNLVQINKFYKLIYIQSLIFINVYLQKLVNNNDWLLLIGKKNEPDIFPTHFLFVICCMLKNIN